MSNMFRRFSTKVGLSKDQKEPKKATNGVVNGNGVTNGTTNGTTNGATNGVTNGTSSGKPGLTKRNTIFSQKAKAEPAPGNHAPAAKREDVETTFKQFSQLVHASQRPIPTQTGDGTYIEHQEPPGMFADLKALGFKDARTLMDVMKTKAAGGLTDDRTYLMEKVIQVKRSMC